MVRPGFNSFDVGGQGGYVALMLAKLSKGGRVVSFECDPEAVAVMRETFERNPFPIEAVQTFVGKIGGDDRTTLDTVADKTFMPDFIKIDVEGAELEVLQGAYGIFSSRKPSLILETHSMELETACIDLLRGYGYEPRIVDQRRWFHDHRPIEHNRWLVCEGPVHGSD
jgi:precorrin-6B methylase 2